MNRFFLLLFIVNYVSCASNISIALQNCAIGVGCGAASVVFNSDLNEPLLKPVNKKFPWLSKLSGVLPAKILDGCSQGAMQSLCVQLLGGPVQVFSLKDFNQCSLLQSAPRNFYDASRQCIEKIAGYSVREPQLMVANDFFLNIPIFIVNLPFHVKLNVLKGGLQYLPLIKERGAPLIKHIDSMYYNTDFFSSILTGLAAATSVSRMMHVERSILDSMPSHLFLGFLIALIHKKIMFDTYKNNEGVLKESFLLHEQLKNYKQKQKLENEEKQLEARSSRLLPLVSQPKPEINTRSEKLKYFLHVGLKRAWERNKIQFEDIAKKRRQLRGYINELDINQKADEISKNSNQASYGQSKVLFFLATTGFFVGLVFHLFFHYGIEPFLKVEKT